MTAEVEALFARMSTAIDAGLASRAAVGERAPRGGRDAAVLALFDSGHGPGVEDLALTFVEKSAHLRRHAGQLAFPGGGSEPEDADVVVTALREATEETGLDPATVQIMAVLPTVSVPTGYDVTAVVAYTPVAPDLRVADPGEIASVHRVPLAALIDPAHRHTATLDRGYSGPAFGVPALDTRPGVYIWGLTAHLLDTILDLAGLNTDWDRDRRIPVPQQYR